MFHIYSPVGPVEVEEVSSPFLDGEVVPPDDSEVSVKTIEASYVIIWLSLYAIIIALLIE